MLADILKYVVAVATVITLTITINYLSRPKECLLVLLLYTLFYDEPYVFLPLAIVFVPGVLNESLLCMISMLSVFFFGMLVYGLLYKQIINPSTATMLYKIIYAILAIVCVTFTARDYKENERITVLLSALTAIMFPT